MRVVLIGSGRHRDRLRWRLRDTGVTVVGEFATIAEADEAGLPADALVLATDDRAARDRNLATLEDTRRVVSRDRITSVRLPDVEPLTPRELEVLERLAEGLPNKTIAKQLGISDQTVKFHVASIIGKLGASNRTEAVWIAVRGGVIAI